MDKFTIIAKLREHEGELKAAGIEHLFLHGSYARGTAIRKLSDVDVIAEFAPGRRLSVLDMVAIENRLADMLRNPRGSFPGKRAEGAGRSQSLG